MKLRKLSSIFTAIFLLTASFSCTTFASTTSQDSPKRYIIKFKTNNVDGGEIVSKYNGDFKHQFKHLNATVADMTPQNINKLQKDSNIEYVEEDNVVNILATSYTNWGVSDINATTSYQQGLTGSGVKIAVIDSGAGPHSDLKIAGGTNVISDSYSTSYYDDNGHGTHVAGVIGGQGTNGGVTGVAPDASLYAVKALDSEGAGYTSDIIAGIDWAIDNDMDIISMSLGSSESSISLENAVNTAYNAGILVVAAAGNDGNASGTDTNINYPANYSSVIAVGAVSSSHTRASFSSTGSKLEVSAPGVDIVSTYLNGKYAKMSGTSMATPFVAGDLALLKQKYPSYTNVQLRELLDSNIIDLGSTGRDSLYGYGLIQAPTNETTATTIPVTSVSLNKTSNTLSIGDTDTLTATINPSNATDQTITWSSSNSSVVTVDSDGKITAKKAGTATITVKTKDGNYTATCAVAVTTIPVTSVALNKNTATLNIGDTDTLIATVNPSDATNQAVTWSSSKSSVVKVDSNGKITANKTGTATITVKTNDGKYTATCAVTVTTVPVTSVTLNKSTTTLNVEDTDALIATINPSNATNQAVTWSSSNSRIVKVDSSGKLTAKKAGTATITVKTKDGKYTATCVVTVE